MISPHEAKLEILADPEALARRAADWLLAAAVPDITPKWELLLNRFFDRHGPAKLVEEVRSALLDPDKVIISVQADSTNHGNSIRGFVYGTFKSFNKN